MIPGNGIETVSLVRALLFRPAFYLMIPGNGIETLRDCHNQQSILLSI